MSDKQSSLKKVKITKKITIPNPKDADVEDEMVDLGPSDAEPTVAYSLGEDNPFQVDDAEDAVTITLPSSLDLVVSGAFKEALLYATSLNKKLILESSDVEQLSTPAIQLILAAQIELEKKGNEAVLLAPSQELASAFDDLGLFSSLMKWKVEA